MSSEDALGGRWAVLVLLVGIRLSLGVQFQSVVAVGALLVGPLLADFGALGVLIGIVQLPGAVVALPGGWMTARFGDRRILVAGLALMVAGGVGVAIAPDFLTALAGRLLAGTGLALVNLVLTKGAMDRFAGADLTIAISWLLAAWPCGIALCMMLLPPIAVASGWRAALLVAAAPALLGLLTIAAGSYGRDRDSDQDITSRGTWPIPAVWPALLMVAVAWAGFNASLGFSPPLARNGPARSDRGGLDGKLGRMGCRAVPAVRRLDGQTIRIAFDAVGGGRHVHGGQRRRFAASPSAHAGDLRHLLRPGRGSARVAARLRAAAGATFARLGSVLRGVWRWDGRSAWPSRIGPRPFRPGVCAVVGHRCDPCVLVAGLGRLRGSSAPHCPPLAIRQMGGRHMRRDIEFSATDGTILRGWHYAPGPGSKHPTVVMAHGLSAVKEMYLDHFAEEFVRAGLACVVFDNRCLGASDGEPRQELDPWLQSRDYSDAITFAQSLDATDPERIGIWGSSYSGGHVLTVAATDARVKCVVSQVPLMDGLASFRPRFGPQLLDALRADRTARAAGRPPGMMAVVSQDSSTLAATKKEDAYRFFTETAASRAPSWRNEMTLRSIEYAAGYLPAAYTPYISPAPFLLILAEGDALPMDVAVAAFERAKEPKRLVVLKCGHYDVYTQMFEEAVRPACEWFSAHLRS